MGHFVKLYLRQNDLTQKKVQHMIGRELLRSGLKRDFDTDFSEDMLAFNAHGKPELSGLDFFFNISHCKGAVVCVIGNIQVGVDVEVPRGIHGKLIQMVCSEEERKNLEEWSAWNSVQDLEKSLPENFAFFRLWTLKESYAKMIGEGLQFPLRELSFKLDFEDSLKSGVWLESADISCNKEGYFYQTILDTGHIISICTKEKLDS